MTPLVNGTRYGLLTVMRAGAKTKRRNARTWVKCDCGKWFETRSTWLVRGKVDRCKKCSGHAIANTNA